MQASFSLPWDSPISYGGWLLEPEFTDMQLIQQINIHSSINTSIPSGDIILKLDHLANDLQQRLTKRNNAETAKQKAAYAKSAWYQLQKAQAEEVKARQRFIQAAVASASSRCQP